VVGAKSAAAYSAASDWGNGSKMPPAHGLPAVRVVRRGRERGPERGRRRP